VLQFVSEVSNVKAGDIGVEEQIVLSNPILEAFGNAKTLRNNNSSRFGKWMDIVFDKRTGGILGAEIVNYLLEKSRVVTQAPGERSFHVFYQLCEGASHEIRAKFCINNASEFSYLRKSGCFSIEGVKDAIEFEHLLKSLDRIHFSSSEIEDLLRVLATILHLGNISFEDKGNDSSGISSESPLSVLSEVSGISADTLLSATCERVVKIKSDVQRFNLKKDSAEETRDAISKALYGYLFDWLVMKINSFLNLKADSQSALSMGILDIFGFEVFERNSLEQFFINLANEQLQNHFVHHILKIEQEEYAAEEIDFRAVSYEDNVEAIMLLHSIVDSCDEEVLLPKGSDRSFVEKLNSRLAEKQKSKHYAINLTKPLEFSIKHYAGSVTYTVTGFLDKNRDILHDWAAECFSQSKFTFFDTLLKLRNKESNQPAHVLNRSLDEGKLTELTRSSSNLKLPSVSKRRVQTLGSKFRDQLSTLMLKIENREPRFVRCLKPNNMKTPNNFDPQLVLNQLKYSGLFEVIKIRASGFPFRKPLTNFSEKYKILLSPEDRKLPPKQRAIRIINKYLQDEELKKHYCVGKTKIFFRDVIISALDQHLLKRRTMLLLKSQSVIRAFLARRRFRTLKTIIGDATKAAQASNLRVLEEVFDQAESIGLLDYVQPRFIQIYEFLKEEQRIQEILMDAILESNFAGLEAGLKQADAIDLENRTQSEKIKDLLIRAGKQHQTMIQHEAIRKKIEAALIMDDLSALQNVHDEAGKLFFLEPTLMGKLNQAIAEIMNDQKIIEKLNSAIKRNQIELIEKSFVEATQISRINEERIELIKRAEALVKKTYTEKIHVRKQEDQIFVLIFLFCFRMQSKKGTRQKFTRLFLQPNEVFS
jgi:myosin heavy subunit